jgi:hypothetical protein
MNLLLPSSSMRLCPSRFVRAVGVAPRYLEAISGGDVTWSRSSSLGQDGHADRWPAGRYRRPPNASGNFLLPRTSPVLDVPMAGVPPCTG